MTTRSVVRRNEPEPEKLLILAQPDISRTGAITLPELIRIVLIHGIGLPDGLTGIRLSGRRIGFFDVGHMGFFGSGFEHTSLEVVQRSKRLWIAVLHQAIEDAKGCGRPSEKNIGGIQHEALRWIFQGNSRAPNSFDSICCLLDIDPGQARQRLRLMPGIRRGLDKTGLDADERRDALAKPHQKSDSPGR